MDSGFVRNILGFTVAGILVTSSAFGASFYKSTYKRDCRYSHPLDTYDGCAPHTYAGEQAYACAELEALLACEDADNSDCLVVGASYKTIISTEFPGYKACEVKVTVHGYTKN